MAIPFSQRALELVGDRDPLEILAATPDELRRIARDHDDVALRTAPEPGEWTPIEILGHLLDHEVVTAYRLRRALSEPHAIMGGYPQEDWVRTLDHASGDAAELLTSFAALRRENLRVWSPLSEAQLAGEIAREGGEVQTLRLMRLVHAGHDLAHLDQLRRYLAP